MGTAAYMSPEQVQGLDIDQRSDIFSFGAILYELLCGRRPFQSDSSIDTMHKIVFSPPPPLQDVVPWLPESLRVIVDRCLEKEPDNRYASTKDIAADLRRVIRHLDAGLVSQAQPQMDWGPPTPGSGGQRLSGSGQIQPPRSGEQGPRSGSGAQVPSGAQRSGAQHPSGGLSISGGFVGQQQVSGGVSAPVARIRPRRKINLVAWIYRTVLVVLVALAGYLWYSWPEFAPVETLPLEETPAIVKAREDGPVVWEWLAYDKISPALRRSVVAELDPDFFDPAIGTPEGNEALQQAARNGKLGEMPKRIVGLSPISRAAVRWGMLSPGNPLGAVEAAAFAVGLEKRISRESALEVLLNTAQFADGIYGVEAATQTFFKKPARSLSPEEAAILAVYLHFPDETSIDNPDNLAIARRDRLIEKVANRKPAASGGSSSGTESGSTPKEGTSTSDTPKSDSETPNEPYDSGTADEPEPEAELPPGSDLPDNG
jgi:hypothetical protein